jgi:hypothetical protein
LAWSPEPAFSHYNSHLIGVEGFSPILIGGVDVPRLLALTSISRYIYNLKGFNGLEIALSGEKKVTRGMAQTSFALKWGGIFFLTAIGYFIFKLYQQRTFFRRTVEKYNLVSGWSTHLI